MCWKHLESSLSVCLRFIASVFLACFTLWLIKNPCFIITWSKCCNPLLHKDTCDFGWMWSHIFQSVSKYLAKLDKWKNLINMLQMNWPWNEQSVVVLLLMANKWSKTLATIHLLPIGWRRSLPPPYNFCFFSLILWKPKRIRILVQLYSLYTIDIWSAYWLSKIMST